MRVKVLFLTIIITLLSCSNDSDDTNDYNKLVTNPAYESPFDNDFTLKLVDSLNITTEARPNDYMNKDIFADTLLFGNDWNEKNKIDVYDLKNKKFLKTIEIADYKVKNNFASISVHSLDTILIAYDYPPEFQFANFEGKIIKDIKLGDLKLTIDNPKAPKTDNYRLPIFNDKPIIYNNKLYFTITPMGVQDLPGFKRVERIAIYDLKKDSLIKAVCPMKGPIALKGVFYLSQLMNPYFIINDNKLFVSYPIDHYIYEYDLDGNFIKKILASASKLEKLPSPLKFDKRRDREYVRDWWLPIPFYGPLSYHKQAQVYTRIFHQSQPLKMLNGELNNGSKRDGYVLIYDKNFNKIGEVKFTNGRLGLYKVFPLSDGFLMAPNQEHWTNENELIYKYVYKFKKN